VDQIATVWPWDISFDRSTGVFRLPIRLQHVQETYTYYVVVLVRPDPNRSVVRGGVRGLRNGGG
jgi:hypothetical protein